jgi:hypothetical protein
MSVLFAQSLTRFAADRMLPIVTSDKESNVFFSFDKRYWARDSMKPRAIGTMAAEGGFGVTTASFFCNTFALMKRIPDRLRRNSDTPLNQDRVAMRFVMQMERIRREKQFVADCLATSKWSTDKTGVSSAPGANQFLQWDNPASTPIEDIRGFRQGADLLTLGAARPNVLGLGKQVWDKLADHPDIVDRLKYGGQLTGNLAKVTPDMLAALLELDEVIVADAVEETSIEGAASSGAYMWGKKALLLYRNPSPTPQVEEVSAGYTFCWQDLGAVPQGWRIKKYRDELTESDVVEVQSSFQQNLVAADAGVFLNTPVA